MANAQTSATPCKCEDLKGLVDQYFQALEMHNASSLFLASNVKSTENGVELAVGAGFWQARESLCSDAVWSIP